MPVSFQFVNNETGNRDSLAHVDDSMCAYAGIDPDPDYCLMLDPMAESLIWFLFKNGGSEVKFADIPKYLELRGDTPPPVDQVRFMRFVLRQWTFHAWR